MCISRSHICSRLRLLRPESRKRGQFLAAATSFGRVKRKPQTQTSIFLLIGILTEKNEGMGVRACVGFCSQTLNMNMAQLLLRVEGHLQIAQKGNDKLLNAEGSLSTKNEDPGVSQYKWPLRKLLKKMETNMKGELCTHKRQR